MSDLVARLRAFAAMYDEEWGWTQSGEDILGAADAIEAAESNAGALEDAMGYLHRRAEAAEGHLRAAQDQDSLTIEKLQEALAAAEARVGELKVIAASQTREIDFLEARATVFAKAHAPS